MSRELISGKIALVTGGGSGIGKATALLLAREGASAIFVGDVDEESAAATAGDIVRLGGSSWGFGVDVRDPEAVESFIQTPIGKMGRLDCAVNCAGVDGPVKMLHDYSNADWKQVMAVNLDGLFYCMRAEVKVMANTEGAAIVNVASAIAADPAPGMSAYGVSKGGVVTLTRSTAGEYVGHGIRINAVLPGATRTPMWEAHSSTPERRAYIERRLTMGRPAEPSEIAEAIVWLCSGTASYVTGAALLVDGGAHAWKE